jgi:cytochrome c-type biogenesis protein CcsB
MPPIPALQSYWLVLHVSFAFIGEAFFAFAFVAAIYYLIINDEEKKKKSDKIIYTSIGVGYPIYTAGALIFGAIWAQYAWGRYWSWDPKETWALITWFIYTGYLHTRLVKRWRGKITAILAIAGFVFTIFTFFGVNYLLSGLHSYG